MQTLSCCCSDRSACIDATGVNALNDLARRIQLLRSVWKSRSPLSSQEAFLEEHELAIEACKRFSYKNHTSASHKDPFKDDFNSVKNLLCQLNSVASVTHMWRADAHPYDAVVYLRPDVLFNCPFPVDVLEALEDDTVYVPDFHHYGGVNDRFAMGKPHAVERWGERCVLACTMLHLTWLPCLLLLRVWNMRTGRSWSTVAPSICACALAKYSPDQIHGCESSVSLCSLLPHCGSPPACVS